MKYAVRCRTAVILASLIAGISLANAASLITVDGWRYIEGPNELHVYVCDRSDCLRGSQVIYHFDPPNSAAFPGIWHKRETAVSATLDEPSRTFSPFAIDLSTRRMHRVATLSDGSKTYYVDGGVNGPKWRASLSSASRDEHASQANLERSAVALKGAKN